MPFSDHQNEVIITSLYSSSALNFAGALFTIVTYLIFKEARNAGTTLVFYLAISDFTTGFADCILWIFLVDQKENVYCTIQGVIIMYGLCASMLWALFIGVHLFLVLYKEIDIESVNKYKYVFHVIAWGYPLFACLLPLFKNQYTFYNSHGVDTHGAFYQRITGCY